MTASNKFSKIVALKTISIQIFIIINMQNDLDLKNYKVIKKIGEGSFGEVLLIEDNLTQKNFVAKVFKFECLSNQNQKLFQQNLKSLKPIKNPIIIPIIGYSFIDFENQNNPTIVTEYLPNGSLADALKNNINLTPTNKYIILLGVAEGMKYLHSHKIVHGNLKPENILLDQKLYPHICDHYEFKLSKVFHSSNIMEIYNSEPIYLSPEIISGDFYSDKTDVYSFSLIAYELLTGKHPFSESKSTQQIKNDVTSGMRPDILSIKNKNIQDFIQKCWSVDPSNRLSFESIVNEIKSEEFKNAMKVNENEISQFLSLFIDEPKMKDLSSETSKNFYGDEISVEEINDDDIVEENEECLEMCKKATKYYKGDGVPINKKEAVRLYKESADNGCREAMFIYAKMKYLGDGTPVDKNEAAHYYKLSAKRGNASSVFQYANILYNGDGIESNKKEAIKYFKIAAENGNSTAMVMCAKMQYSGEGVPVNKNEAKETLFQW